jgi:hypothetical protein
MTQQPKSPENRQKNGIRGLTSPASVSMVRTKLEQ